MSQATTNLQNGPISLETENFVTIGLSDSALTRDAFSMLTILFTSPNILIPPHFWNHGSINAQNYIKRANINLITLKISSQTMNPSYFLKSYHMI